MGRMQHVGDKRQLSEEVVKAHHHHPSCDSWSKSNRRYQMNEKWQGAEESTMIVLGAKGRGAEGGW